MVRMFLRTGSVLALTLGLIAPATAFAAYNDVTLTGSAVLTVNGVTLNIAGSNNVVQSLKVDSTSVTATMLPSSYFSVSAPNLNQLSQTGGDAYLTKTCNASASTMAFQTTNSATIVVTPSSSLCSASTAGGGGGISGGGGGGSSSSSVTTAVTTNTSTTGAAPSTAPVSGGQSPSSTAGAGAVTFTRTLAYGATGADVSALQRLLINESFFSGSANGVFGPKTRAAVRAFQRENGLKVTGKADAATFAALGAAYSAAGTAQAALTSSQIQSIVQLLQSFGADAATVANVQATLQGQPTGQPGSQTGATFTKTLYTGSRGTQVIALQQMLTNLGFYTGPIIGRFGPKTKAAVKAFQKAHGFKTINGVVGPATRAALNQQ